MRAASRLLCWPADVPKKSKPGLSQRKLFGVWISIAGALLR